MFKFNFDVQSDVANPFTESDENETQPDKSISEEISWRDAQEIIPNKELLDNLKLCRLNSTNVEINGITLTHIISGCILQDIKDHESQTKDMKKAEILHSDLIPGVYEGGAKIWECTTDLLNYLADNETNKFWLNKHVLDLGCGSGLLGIYAYKCQAKDVRFQDYNGDVLEHITIPNVLLNTPLPPVEKDLDLQKLSEKARFYAGDWQNYVKLTDQDVRKFDIILTSETIYNTQNHQKLLNTFDAKLSSTGVVYVAAKVYYFGVGGGVRQFEELIEKDKRFKSEVVWTAMEGVNREILKLNRIVE